MPGPFGDVPKAHEDALRRNTRSRGISAPPPIRRSPRLAGIPADSDFVLSSKRFFTPEGLGIHSTVVFDRKKGEWRGEWAYRVNKNTRKKPFFPGQIIQAFDAHPQTVLDKTLDDPCIAQVAAGPVFAKVRAMIVINLTADGIFCLPMYTSKPGKSKPAQRLAEMASICDDNKWKGRTPWAGQPLQMTIYSPRDSPNRSLIELLQPVHVLSASRIIPIGFISGGEYARLMRLLHHKETQARAAAFHVYGETYLPITGWAPKPRIHRPYPKAKANMHNRTGMRW
ncbi:hypothetical protein M436DRAFT_46541 [Aureobasidium namibiae CBS 147.97]|uniref:DUF6590 domain-containing protein n=1 Tax=Aureobasidium namibiae CBS 147.97 TaxID=1043004 RepID=A0A074XF56_9PEZI|nr:uncharacterized protein M436DRAFT_46541 [Aureobasidium namibiae CBS 147.97]KEQ73236.1 hypothetical protein M436DRAFT_46541 [Aureobasidium namibiae CBS 147.97]